MSGATFLDAVLEALIAAGRFNRRDEVAPAVVFWPDRAGEWQALLPRLREEATLLTLGPYAPDEAQGPAAWVRCAVLAGAREAVSHDGSNGQAPAVQPAIVYLPGLGVEELRATGRWPLDRLPLADLWYRGAAWLQPDGRDWTVAAFLERRDGGGLGVELRPDPNTREALLRALPKLSDEPVARLRAEVPWRAADFDALGGASGTAGLDLRALIEQGESVELEFKPTARWDAHQGKKADYMEHNIQKAVAGYLNSEQGGTLLIGVRDDGSICGIEEDYQAFSQVKWRNRDGYERWLLQDLLLKKFGKQFGRFIGITFHTLDGRDVCRLAVRPAPEPAFLPEGLEEAFYVRSGNATLKLTTREALAYCRERWG